MSEAKGFTIRDRRRVIHDLDDDPEDDRRLEEEDPGIPTDPAFSKLVMFLANNAVSALGMGPDGQPTGHQNPEAALEFLEMLKMLESKTRNQLSFEDTSMLTQILGELQSMLTPPKP